MSSETDDVVVCRACVGECLQYKSLHKQGLIFGEVTTLATLLHFCTNLDFPANEDNLPGNICLRCVQNLAKSYAFKKMVLEANELLRRKYTDMFILDCNEQELEEQQEHYVENVVADELEELANAAQLKRELDNIGYVTLTVLQINDEEQEANDMNKVLSENSDSVSSEQAYHVKNVTEIEEIADEEADEDEEVYLKLEQNDNGDEGETYEIIVPDEESQSPTTERCQEREFNALKRKYSTGPETEDESCNNMPKEQTVLKTRMKRQPKPDNPDLQCKECGKQLSNQNSFKYHMQLHSDATPFLCSLCGQGFKTRNAYEGHKVLHNPNNPNTCKLCGKSYRQSHSLRSHMLTHTGEKPFQCDICGKGMTQKSGYKKHMLTHTGEKPHTCDVCGRDFRYSSNLIAHKRCHSGEKPYVCPHCDKCFPTSEQMKRHTLVHNGDRPFSCTVCGKNFKRSSSLLAHHSTHKEHCEVNDKLSKSNIVELY